MSWDPAILRKFNTTGHFRLLNQLRGELKAHPLPRQQAEGDAAAGGTRGAGTGAIEMRPQPWVTAVRAAPVATAPHPASRNPSATPLSWTPTVHPGAFAIGSMRSTCVELLKHDPRHREQNKLQRRLQRCQQLIGA